MTSFVQVEPEVLPRFPRLHIPIVFEPFLKEGKDILYNPFWRTDFYIGRALALQLLI